MLVGTLTCILSPRGPSPVRTGFGWGPHGGRPYVEDTPGTPLGPLPLIQSPPPLIHVWHRQRPFPHSLRQMTDNCPGLGCHGNSIIKENTEQGWEICSFVDAGSSGHLCGLEEGMWRGGPRSARPATHRTCVCACVPVCARVLCLYLCVYGTWICMSLCVYCMNVCVFYEYVHVCMCACIMCVYVCVYYVCVYVCV